MTDLTQQPTILVKKADGTTTRMTLEQVKAMQTEKTTAVAQPSQPQVEIKKPLAPIYSIEPIIKKTEKIINPTSVKQWTREDSKSLLEEKLDKKENNAPLVSLGRQNQVAQVLSKLNFKIAPENSNRFQSIIQLRLKDIRDEEQTRDSLLKPVLEGGMALPEEQTEKVMAACSSIIASQNVSEGAAIQLKKDGLSKSGIALSPLAPRNDRIPMIEPEELPQVYHEPAVPATSTPFNTFSGQRKGVAPLPQNNNQARLSRYDSNDNLKLNTAPAVKKVMRDVVSPVVEMGPIEDIGAMSLIDFRRLSPNPAEAAARLKQKLLNLKDEAYLLYLDGLAAWHNSPLFRDYISAVSLSLLKRQPLKTTMADKNKLQVAELEAIVKMEREL